MNSFSGERQHKRLTDRRKKRKNKALNSNREPVALSERIISFSKTEYLQQKEYLQLSGYTQIEKATSFTKNIIQPDSKAAFKQSVFRVFGNSKTLIIKSPKPSSMKKENNSISDDELLDISRAFFKKQKEEHMQKVGMSPTEQLKDFKKKLRGR